MGLQKQSGDRMQIAGSIIISRKSQQIEAFNAILTSRILSPVIPNGAGQKTGQKTGLQSKVCVGIGRSDSSPSVGN